MTLEDLTKLRLEIRATSSSNEKMQKLDEAMKYDGDDLLNILELTYSPNITFGSTRKTITDNIIVDGIAPSLPILRLIEVLETKECIKNNKLYVATEEDKETILQVFDRKLDWKLGATQINKVHKQLYPLLDNFIYVPRYMRCSSLNEKTTTKIVYPAFSQVKADSEFTNLFIKVD